MKFQLASDLHLEFYSDGGVRFVRAFEAFAPRLFLAGDILVLKDIQRTIAIFEIFCSKFEEVFYIPGNHEYYDQVYLRVQKRLKALDVAIKNLHVLHHGVRFEREGRSIYGDTMWFPYKASARQYMYAMNDFNLVRGLTPAIYTQNQAWTDVARRIEPGSIVMTHHLPSYRSVTEKYKNSSLNPFFVSNCEAIIRKTQPAIWMHGHTHMRQDYNIGPTRVVCNPRGYPGSGTIKWWKKNFVIDV